MVPSSGPELPQPSASPYVAEGAAVRQGRFDRWAAHYEHSQLQQMLYEPVHHKVLEHARRRVPAPHRILDIGCGTGRLTRACTRCFPGATVIGIDPSAAMTKQATMSPTSAWWLQARAETLPFGDHVFSLIVSTLSLRHWQNAHQGLTEISRIATLNGTVVIADALMDEALPPPPTTAPPGDGGSRRVRRRILHPATRLRRRRTTEVPAGVPYALAQAGLELKHLEQIVLAVATVTLIIAENSATRAS